MRLMGIDSDDSKFFSKKINKKNAAWGQQPQCQTEVKKRTTFEPPNRNKTPRKLDPCDM
jgi:hypothetical protein